MGNKNGFGIFMLVLAVILIIMWVNGSLTKLVNSLSGSGSSSTTSSTTNSTVSNTTPTTTQAAAASVPVVYAGTTLNTDPLVPVQAQNSFAQALSLSPNTPNFAQSASFYDQISQQINPSVAGASTGSQPANQNPAIYNSAAASFGSPGFMYYSN